jgi:hypothetical protein
MTPANLPDYLNDHLAGSVAALSLLDRMIPALGEAELASVLETVRAAIIEDRALVERVIAGLDASESSVKKAIGWVTEMFSRLKTDVDEGQDSVELQSALEALTMGIHGRTCLLRTLQRIRPLAPALESVDLDALLARAEEHRDRVEGERLRLATHAFAAQSARE